ncbi:MAG: ABC transporter substrate-binding protein, partial [Burkholderiales bacterium]|nr:ABC transporter substrate-binding protein [Opitutaceae bacterium]
LLAACSREAAAPASGQASGSPAPTRVRLQSDWYAQAEHGGYYQAVAKGFDKEAGIELVITQGGPGSFGTQKVVTGQAEFSMGRSDDTILAIQQGLPVVIVTALMQHDPQALLLHEENPVNSFADLDGKNIMSTPGVAWIEYIRRKHQIQINVIPLNYGFAQFMADKNFIQQCFITNEPYYVAKNGAKPKTLLIADSGYDPYRVIFTSQKFLRENPAAVRAFVAAATRGWHDFLNEDPAPGMALISKDNEKMDADFMRYSIRIMNERRLVAGDPAKGERIGLITRERIEGMVENLASTGLLTAPLPAEKIAAFDLVPPVVP